MVRVEFHTGVVEPVHFACRLLRKALRQGVPVLVTAPAPTLQALDRALWTFDAQEFLPHLTVRRGQEVGAALRRTPIWLCEDEPPPGGPKVLLNLGRRAGCEPSRFERIIEVVSADAEERQLARARWRDYDARGCDIQHHPHAAA
jgi:DNA polymerase III subunit chi